MNEVAVYLQALRDGQHLSRAKLADLVDTTDNTIWRIESGRQEPGGPLLVRMVQALGGAWPDVQWLLSSRAANSEEARRRANLLLEKRHAGPLPDAMPPTWSTQKQIEHLVSSTDPETLQAIIDDMRHNPTLQTIIDDLRRNPTLLDLVERLCRVWPGVPQSEQSSHARPES